MPVFGPVPSRRLGQSLGINNIPPKTCSYSCIYCQLGRTNRRQVKREEFYNPEDILDEARTKMEEIYSSRKQVDYITFVSDGEPTLDQNLGIEIDLLRQFKEKIAVISNSSLIWMDEVKRDLLKTDWLSLKIDAADNSIWQRIDRPHGTLALDKIMKGILDFAESYKGTLVTETMLVSGYNDYPDNISSIGMFLKRLRPSKAYLLVPTRPPAEKVQRPSYNSLQEVGRIIGSLAQVEVEFITGDEGDNFFVTDNSLDDLLNIFAVHPVKRETAIKLLKERNQDITVLESLVAQGLIEEYSYENNKFYIRKNQRK